MYSFLLYTFISKLLKDVQQMNVIDIFSGCGGLSYGLKMAGYNVLLGIDNDRAALESFEYNHKSSRVINQDITTLLTQDIIDIINKKEIDVIVGGPPCQGMSISGPRQFQDPRNKLYLSFIHKVADIRPKAFIIENVPGLVSLFKGKIKDSILEEFRELGYNVSHQILLASDYGIPQNRKRVFFVGIREDLARGKFIFPAPNTLLQDQKVTAEQAISDLPTLSDHLSLGEDFQEYKSAPQNKYQKLMRLNSTVVRNHIGTKHSDKTREIIGLVPEGGNYKNLPEEYRSSRNFNVAWTRYHSQKPTHTIDTGHRHHFHYRENRVPTVRENARFQSFPDDFIFIGNKTEQYRQVGNAVPPILAKILGEALSFQIK
ncbi:DNA cytosine methyltransferase [Shouchella hunanensis]|uniref:Cytosine-specific methyltransferase n=1 Tax=Shouchella hunanensis TaxID=766894 RepID=A0ABY7WD29_9BACI|nr:DNA cytosine methyltransferase [Shouchella hunanensis]WDF05534.1 DNA cytosine methyltransferase [Shouchella hunanensis]